LYQKLNAYSYNLTTLFKTNLMQRLMVIFFKVEMEITIYLDKLQKSHFQNNGKNLIMLYLKKNSYFQYKCPVVVLALGSDAQLPYSCLLIRVESDFFHDYKIQSRNRSFGQRFLSLQQKHNAFSMNFPRSLPQAISRFFVI
jgi:hypothetical protein